MPSYNDVLNNVGSRMQQQPTTITTPITVKPRESQSETDTVLNKIGLEVQRQGGTR